MFSVAVAGEPSVALRGFESVTDRFSVPSAKPSSEMRTVISFEVSPAANSRLLLTKTISGRAAADDCGRTVPAT